MSDFISKLICYLFHRRYWRLGHTLISRLVDRCEKCGRVWLPPVSRWRDSGWKNYD